MIDEDPIEPSLSTPLAPRADRAGRKLRLAVLGAFVLGLATAGLVGWLGGADFARFLRLPIAGTWSPTASSSGIAASQPGFTAPSPGAQNATRDELAFAERVAAVERRLDRVDLRVEAASGNAARAEALLVAFAVRRVVERGAPLGYLADQLKLRFGDAQPNAVATIVGGARDLVPLDQLAARLVALTPQLTDDRQPPWRRITRELSELLVVRRDRPAQSSAESRLDDARKALSEGRIDDAIADVQQLSTGAEAANWVTAARRTRDVERALDLIDTTALLVPQRVRDAGGNPVNAVVQ